MTDLVLYDGICGLCDRFIQFLLARDRTGRFRYAPLQGTTARRILEPRGLDPGDLDTVWVVADYGGPEERLLSRGRAVTHLLRALGGGWRIAAAANLLPAPILDTLYRFVARRRYRWFGRYDACPLPREEDRGKFLE